MEVVLKFVLRETNTKLADQRTRNLIHCLTEGSSWTLLKVCSLENFNRSYVGYDQFQICNLHTSLLNLSASVNQGQSSYPLQYRQYTFPDPGFPLNLSQIRALNQCFQSQGIVVISGGYSTGKSSLVPLITHGLLAAENAIREEKQR